MKMATRYKHKLNYVLFLCLITFFSIVSANSYAGQNDKLTSSDIKNQQVLIAKQICPQIQCDEGEVQDSSCNCVTDNDLGSDDLPPCASYTDCAHGYELKVNSAGKCECIPM